MHCNAVQCSAMNWYALQCTAMYCNALQCTTMHCSVLQCTVMHCNALRCAKFTYILLRPNIPKLSRFYALNKKVSSAKNRLAYCSAEQCSVVQCKEWQSEAENTHHMRPQEEGSPNTSALCWRLMQCSVVVQCSRAL